MKVLLFLLSLFFLQEQKDLPVLRVGETVKGVIEDGDPVVHTEILDTNYTQSPTVGKKYLIEVSEPGHYTIDMKSLFFDTYLVLRDREGKGFAEDDDGLYGTHSRIVFQSKHKDEVCHLEACALHGKRGDYELRLMRGKQRELTPQEKQKVILGDAREEVRIIEDREGKESPALAPALNNLALLLRAEGDYEEAKALFERVLGISEKVFGPEHPNTAASLNNLAALVYYQGNYEEAKPLFERALEIREKVLGPEDPDTALSLGNLAGLLQAQGNYDEAKHFFERALEIREKVLGPEDPDTATSLNNLAGLLYCQGDYEEAKALFERVVGIYEKVLGPEDPDTALSLNNLAGLLYYQGNYGGAKPLFERVLGIYEKILGPEHRHTSASLNNLASLLKAEGNYEEAKHFFKRALGIREKVLGPEDPDTALSLDNLAALLQDQGNYEEAKPLYERALGIREKVLGPEHTDTALSLNNLGGLLQDQGNYEEAKPLYERALGIREKVLGPEHPHTATSLNNLALLLAAQGNYEEANPLYERALGICEKVLGPEHPHTALGFNNLAALLRAQGNYEEAKPLYEQALGIYEKVLGPEHPHTAESLGNLAGLLSDLGEEKEAWELAQRAITAGEAQLQRVLWSLFENDRLLYAAKKRWFLELLLSLGKTLSSVDKKRAAYEVLLRWKGRVSRSFLQSRESLAGKLTPQAREILSELKRTQSQLSKALFTQEIKERKIHEARLSRLRKERKELEERLVRYIGWTEEKPLVRVGDLRVALPESSAIVDFYIHRWYEPAKREENKGVKKGGWSEPHLSAWVLCKGNDELVHVDLGPAGPIEKAVGAFLEVLVSSRGISLAGTEGQSLVKKTNDALCTLLWEPLSGHLKGAKTIFLSPDAFLGTLPLEVLQLKDKTYLIELHGFVYLQDMVSLVEMVKEKKGEEALAREGLEAGLLVVGGVDYRKRGGLGWQKGEEEESTPAEALCSNLLASEEVRRNFSPFWEPLQGTVQELEAIAALYEEVFGEKGKKLLLQGEAASEERVKAKLPFFRVVHLATHGFFEPKGLPSMWERVKEEEGLRMEMRMEEKRVTGMLPGFLSGLVCAGANRPAGGEREDGLLTAEEITWLNLSQVDLVVLSACETGLGSPRGGEGMVGLRRSLRQAGVKTVISSLWNVRDASTSELMRNFYHRLWLKGEIKLDSLRNAQLDMLKKNRIEHNGNGLPVTWGAFVLDGDWR